MLVIVLRVYSDSAWTSDPTYCILLGSSPIAWKYEKQAIVSHSSTAAELRALATATSEIV